MKEVRGISAKNHRTIGFSLFRRISKGSGRDLSAPNATVLLVTTTHLLFGVLRNFIRKIHSGIPPDEMNPRRASKTGNHFVANW
jgi:hypothetical protein